MDRIGMLLCTFVTAGATGTAGAAACDSLGPASWLLGEWLAQDESKVITESWRELSPETFEGSGETRSILDGKILDAEMLRFERVGDADP